MYVHMYNIICTASGAHEGRRPERVSNYAQVTCVQTCSRAGPNVASHKFQTFIVVCNAKYSCDTSYSRKTLAGY